MLGTSTDPGFEPARKPYLYPKPKEPYKPEIFDFKASPLWLLHLVLCAITSVSYALTSIVIYHNTRKIYGADDSRLRKTLWKAALAAAHVAAVCLFSLFVFDSQRYQRVNSVLDTGFYASFAVAKALPSWLFLKDDFPYERLENRDNYVLCQSSSMIGILLTVLSVVHLLFQVGGLDQDAADLNFWTCMSGIGYLVFLIGFTSPPRHVSQEEIECHEQRIREFWAIYGTPTMPESLVNEESKGKRCGA